MTWTSRVFAETMHALVAEYVLKGIYLGLILFVAVQEPNWQATGTVALCVFCSFLLFLSVAAIRKLREGYRITGRVAAFVLFLLLESPGMVYSGVMLGTLFGAFAVRNEGTDQLLMRMLGGGALLGLAFSFLRTVQQKQQRLAMSLFLAVLIGAGIIYWLDEHPEYLENANLRTMFAVNLLLGLPMFYLLTFVGSAEESEVEIAAMCATLGLSLWMLSQDFPLTRSLAVLIPLALYIVYAVRVLPSLRVFKHVVRGIGYANVGRTRQALLAFRRANELDPENALAREHLWNLHRELDLEKLKDDPQLLALLDFNFCLDRVTSLLVEASPSADKMKEAHHLLDLILSQRPRMKPAISYWRAVAHVHARHFDQAAAELVSVLDPDNYAPDDACRNSILFDAWQLALVLHPEMNRRVGTPQLALPGRRLEAIAAVEKRLENIPDDGGAWTLKRILYSELTEEEYRRSLDERQKMAGAPTQPAADPGAESGAVGAEKGDNSGPSPLPSCGLPHFDHGYAEQLGLALINDSSRWQRGIEFLRIASYGLPGRRPFLFQQIAQAYERAGDSEAARQAYEQAKQAGRELGPKNLDDENRQIYFSIVKQLGDEARARNDLDIAIENYQLYTANERAGVETLRILADLYEKKGLALPALRVTEQALLYNAKDKDLLERKDRYYYSVTPDEVRENRDSLIKFFDVDYCVKKARSLLDRRELDLDLLDWASHLAEVAAAIQPDSVTVKVLRARCFRRRGEIEKAQQILEEARNNKPERFRSSEEQEDWYLVHRLLGELYLNDLNRPDLAIPCFNVYRQSSRSGADTIFKLGLAYEQTGDKVKAAKCYELVTAYESHPLAPDAQDALYRLRD
ncbi:MAG: hypothetical protein KatS3mg105_0336 [Gemmatales bacterium]|nr:MAG: hypothetical protein KatS3mg105_0336 [Gemmatales bacterium]